MALIEFQNNSAPYINANNLNHNFNELREIYSTSEIKTNNMWMDKPIYRKCVNFTSTLTPNNENVIGTIQNLDSVVNINGNGILNNQYVVQFPYIDDTNNIILYCRKISQTNATIVLVPASTNITNINVIIEYTKTTD